MSNKRINKSGTRLSLVLRPQPANSNNKIEALEAQLKAAQDEITRLTGLVKDLQVDRDLALENAQKDPLTKLPNRAFLETRIAQMHADSAAGRKPYAILFIDLDGFKHVNDTGGETAGDELLVVAANKLTVCVRGSDTVCRMGGDEFIVLLENISLKNVLEKVQEIFNKSLRGELVFSIGVFYCDEKMATDLSPEEAMFRANLAEMGAKGRIGNANARGIKLSWDNTLPEERPRSCPAGQYGYAAIALPQGGGNEIFVTGVPDARDPQAPKMSERLKAFLDATPTRTDDSDRALKRRGVRTTPPSPAGSP